MDLRNAMSASKKSIIRQKCRHAKKFQKSRALSEPPTESAMRKTFLSLPLEICNMIYAENVLSQIKLMVVEPACLNEFDMKRFNLAPKSALPSQVLRAKREYGDEKHHAELPSILAFCYRCPAILQEARPVLYSVISVRGCLSYSDNSLWQYNKIFMERLEHLHIWNEFYSCKNDEILRRHPSLKTLTWRFLGQLDYKVGSEGGVVPRQKDVVRRIRYIMDSPYSRIDGAFYDQNMSSSFELVCDMLSSDRRSFHEVSRRGARWIDVEILGIPYYR